MKSLLYTITISTLFLTACSPTDAKKNPDKEASEQFVRAALQLYDAKKLAEDFQFQKAFDEFSDIANKVDSIVSTYPSSTIALRLVSEDNVKIGAFKFDFLKANVIPTMKELTSQDIASIARTWSIASFSNKKDVAFNEIANLVQNDTSLSPEQKQNILQKVPVKVSLKKPQHVAKEINKYESEQNVQKKILSDNEIQQLLKEAEKNAKYCSYELSASEQLLKKSENINVAKYPQFSKILRNALEKASQISIISLREKAFATLAAAAAKSGDETLALEIISYIKNPDAFENVFKSLADTLGKTKNYPSALAIASKLKNEDIKNKFLSTLSINVANQGRVQPAIEIAKQIKDIKIKNDALCQISMIAYDSKDISNFINAITNIDAKNLECLKVFLKYSKNINISPSVASATATLAEMIIPTNKKFGEILNNMAIKNEDNNNSSASIIISNFIALDKYKDAVAYAEKISENTPQKRMLIAQTAVWNIAKGKEDAVNTLNKLVNQIKLEDISVQIQFSYLVETSKLSDDEKNKILKPLFKL
ncbi:MAG: hypothetical protein E7035_00990 [Verrucomicrobiaceae bacterium]|nr:hypothetical protein [Verrucomicrobiaceae bacterium]